MSKYDIDIMYEIRRHLWTELVINEMFDPQEYYNDILYQEIVPIIPVQQSPEMNQFLSGKTHIVYDKIGMSYDDNWLICNDKILFTLYSVDYAELNSIRNLMIDVFRRMDDSARDINDSKSTDLLKVHSTVVLEMSPTEPSDELQGFLSCDVVLEVKYSRIVDPVGRFS